MKINTIVINAAVAALYVVVTGIVAPFSFLNVQFRLSETFNHLIIYNKKYFFGIIVGVFLANLFFSPTKADLVFGVAHTALSLAITMIFARFIANKLVLMVINATVFSFNMYIIAYLLKVFAKLPEAFIPLWISLGISEFLTMILAIFIIYFLNKRIKLNTLIEPK